MPADSPAGQPRDAQGRDRVRAHLSAPQTPERPDREVAAVVARPEAREVEYR